MARFNARGHQARSAVTTVTSPLATETKVANTRTHEGGAGYTRTAKTELFLRATGAFHGGESSFYESADQRDDRLRELVRAVAVDDLDWFAHFVRWLRTEGNMRTAALMAAVDGVKARLDSGLQAPVNSVMPTNREIIDSVCLRADEPGEILAIWSAWYGKNFPMPVKRGVADAARRLYSERSLLKYDTDSRAYRFADVLELSHPSPDPDKSWQGDLFEYAINRRHGHTGSIPTSLRVLRANMHLRDAVRTTPRGAGREMLCNPEVLRDAGMTWEDALSLAGQVNVDKRQVWEAMVPSMGIMALLRNLRNFDQAGVSDKVAQQVIDRLTDPEEIARSRQFPFRFLAAYRATKDSLRWAYPLEQALNHSLVNVPVLDGRTLILVDRSPSMFPEYNHLFLNSRSDISRADQAAVFGSALALRAKDATLVEFHQDSKEISFQPGTSVLKLVERFGKDYGTNIPDAVRKHYAKHDRVVIITDEQTQPGTLPSNTVGWGRMRYTEINDLVPKNIPVFVWNFAGYTAAAMPSGNEARFHLGGLTDKAFRLIPILESGTDGVWPWDIPRK